MIGIFGPERVPPGSAKNLSESIGFDTNFEHFGHFLQHRLFQIVTGSHPGLAEKLSKSIGFDTNFVHVGHPLQNLIFGPERVSLQAWPKIC